MRGQFKILITIFAVSIFLLIPSYSQAQTLPSVRLTAPTVVQAEIGKEFVIPLTIAIGNQESIVGGVRPRVDSTSIKVEEIMLGQILPPNASVNTSLTGIAQAAGIFRVTLDVDAAGFLFSTDVMVEVKDPDEAKRRALFSVARSSFVPLSPDLDKPFTLRITLKNTGNEPSGDVLATLDAGANFTMQSLTNRADAASVNPGETAEVSFVLRAKEGRASNSVALTLSYDTYTQTETLFLPLPDVPDPLSPPVLKVESFILTPAQEGQFVLSLTVVNEGESKAENISLSLDAGGKAFPLTGGNVRTIDALAPDAKVVVEYLLSSQGELAAHPVNIAFDFLDENNTSRKGSDRIFITTNLEPLIGLAAFSARTANEEGEFTLSLSFQNTGLSSAQNITVRFTGNQASPKNKGAVVALADIPAGGSGNLSLFNANQA